MSITEPEIVPPLVLTRPTRTWIQWLKAFLPGVLEGWEASLDAGAAGTVDPDAEAGREVFSYVLAALWRQLGDAVQYRQENLSLRLRLDPDVRLAAARRFRRIWDQLHASDDGLLARLGPELDAFTDGLIRDLAAPA